MKSADSIERKIDLVSSGLSGIKMICPLSDGDFIAADSSGLIRLSVRDIAEIGDISEVTVAVTRDSDSISSAISEFNANSTRFRIKLEDYSEGMEYSIQGHEMAFDNLHMDVISGKNPDMVYLDTNEMDNDEEYLGSDKYHTAEYFDAYALWWPQSKQCTEFNSRALFVNPGDNMAVPPRGTIGYPVNQKVFGKHDLNKIRIQVMTSNGYRIEVKNALIQQEKNEKKKDDEKRK